ncbi:MAG TPA: hypothetical protein PLV92_02265, partial [Pirellulaceae bacterium]|nr:hypothetical protein [Pirellulaceae bacterium]
GTLRMMGPIAESGVLEALDDAGAEHTKVFFITVVLREVGGEKTVAALKKKIADNPPDSIRVQLQATLSHVEGRVQAAKAAEEAAKQAAEKPAEANKAEANPTAGGKPTADKSIDGKASAETGLPTAKKPE